jgi:hypothetical protein
VGIFEEGKTGYQHRNILYGYVLAVPLLLGTDATTFALILATLSVLITSFLLSRIIEFHCTAFFAFLSVLALVLSLPVLRYATQVNSDIPALMLIMGTIYCVWLALERDRTEAIPWAYAFAALSISLRYASAVSFPAFLFFMWHTRKRYAAHGAGLALCGIPFIPQMMYNVHYLKSVYGISYAAQQPVMGLEYFLKDTDGVRVQLLHYIKDLLFTNQGVFVLFLPLVVLGLVRSFTVMKGKFALYLLVFEVSFLVVLSFFASFSFRYALGALLPCFIWLAVGMKTIDDRLRRDGARKTVFYAWVVLALYYNFEIGFQVARSSRAIHEARYAMVEKINALVKNGDIVLCPIADSPYDPRIKSLSLRNGLVRRIGSFDSLTALENGSPSGDVYCAYPALRWFSDGRHGHGDVGAFLRDSSAAFEEIASVASARAFDLSLYTLLRLFHKETMIPGEKWILVKRVQKPNRTGRRHG